MEDEIIIVDENDNVIEPCGKLDAHLKGKLHRAFSIFVFNSRGELLLQKRAETKYHSGGLWSNTCCSHPRFGEITEQAAHRRLKEEMGFDCELKEVFSFTYRTEFENGLIENEYDHVFIGTCDGKPKYDDKEVSDWKYIRTGELRQEIEHSPQKYTYWLRVAFKKLLPFLNTDAINDKSNS